MNTENKNLQQESKKIGQIHPKHTMFLCEIVGSAKNESTGNEYEVLLNSNMSPMVDSKKTGKRFTIDWKQIIDLAIEAGIDNE